MIHAQLHCPSEWTYHSGRAYTDPDEGVTLDLVFTDPGGQEWRAPAFWAGQQTWKVRFAPPQVGAWRYRTVCSDTANRDLHDLEGEMMVAEYEGDNPLLARGPLRVARGGRHLEHADGTPFFWLGDTWWLGLTRRLSWPDDFRELIADRTAQGFTVIQIVAGLYPDMPWPDPRGQNEAGYPWEADFGRLNPAYFDMADLRIAALVGAGLVPCIVGCWGYFMRWMGVERMKRHWRNLVAHWGAYPVIWCLAGEGSMPWYLTQTPEADRAEQQAGWTEVGRYLREIDPLRRPITIHPSTSARDTVDDDSVLDFDMLQTGHGDRGSLPNTVRLVTAGYDREPVMPVVQGEVCYEGILQASREEVQRLMFWASMLSGARGFTYGANGLWQVNRPGDPFGPSPHGRAWGNLPWQEAMRLPGGRHVALGKRLLGRYRWWDFAPHPEWIEPHWTEEDYHLPYAAGIPGEVRVLYLPLQWNPPRLVELEPGLRYRGFWYCPWSGEETPLGTVQGDAEGSFTLPFPPEMGDWVVVLERD